MFLANHLPSLPQLLSGLPTQEPAAICKHLDITPQTIRRWKQAGQAPRMAALAMYYETPWGHSLINTTAHNGHMYERAHRQSLERENAMLRTRIARLESIGDFGAANDPAPSVRTAVAAAGVLLNERLQLGKF